MAHHLLPLGQAGKGWLNQRVGRQPLEIWLLGLPGILPIAYLNSIARCQLVH